MTAPLGSDTVPVRLVVCPNRDAVANTARAQTPKTLFIGTPFLDAKVRPHQWPTRAAIEKVYTQLQVGTPTKDLIGEIDFLDLNLVKTLAAYRNIRICAAICSRT
jgi:hypothetical protein